MWKGVGVVKDYFEEMWDYFPVIQEEGGLLWRVSLQK